MLTFSKNSKPVRKTVVLSGLLKYASIGALNKTNAKIVYNIFEGLWPCDIDERQIKMAIENIVVNAFQAMPGGGTIIVSAENVPAVTPIRPGQPAEKYVRICIRDQGIGIAKENMSRIFDPFFTTKKYGNGLGLAIAYSIVSKHNGIITIESEEGKGTAVFISLPASQSPMSMTRIPPCVTMVHKSRIKTLLMDDNKYIRDVASMTLQTMGHTVVLAADGNQAVELFARAHASVEPFDLVILDLIVPGGMGGAETIKNILSIDPAAIVIASSGNFDDPIMTNPAAFGFASKLGKPYTASELDNLLQQIMPSDRGESDEEEDYPGTGVMRKNAANQQSHFMQY
jgi:CheY-like chemotaxis protein/anti-sigma regulatory factor (Ser/Thr protein kinase)